MKTDNDQRIKLIVHESLDSFLEDMVVGRVSDFLTNLLLKDMRHAHAPF